MGKVSDERHRAEKFPGRKRQDSRRQENPEQSVKAGAKGTRAGRTRQDSRRQDVSESTKTRAGICLVADRCGGCDLQGVDYARQLKQKDKLLKNLLGGLVEDLRPVIGMEHPENYRCKVNAAFGLDRKGFPILGRYEKNSHHIIQAQSCMIEDVKANEIAQAIYGLLRSFLIRVYDEDTGYGLLRHVQIRRGYATGQYMVTLVCTDPVFPSKQNFVKALRKQFPEISTVILNINDRQTSMVLGERNITLYGKGYIEDKLCGCTFRISPGSFYQVNPPQTERLYQLAMQFAELTGKETVLDAYCGTGTIGIIAAGRAKQVTGVELNSDAVRDAVWNARCNKVKNIRFVAKDATDYMDEIAQTALESSHISPDIIILDPPRAGTTPRFIESSVRLAPSRIVYVSCGPESLARDLKLFREKGYAAKVAQGAFPIPPSTLSSLQISSEGIPDCLFLLKRTGQHLPISRTGIIRPP